MFETFVKDLSIGKILAEFKKKIKINWAFVAGLGFYSSFITWNNDPLPSRHLPAQS